jgi:hypothetical protein
LDLCDYNSFTLLVGSFGLGNDKFTALQQRLRGSRINLRIFALGTDFQFANEKHEALFSEQGGFAAGGGLLVRPDQHILTLVSSATSAENLENDVRNHLGL